jgi:hypothetical protein
MKAIVVKILFPMLVLMAFAPALSRNQTTAAPDVNPCNNAEPLRGSGGGESLIRACGNCHSNQTNLPWYGYVVPISWWIKSDVREGRQALNFSDWRWYSEYRRRDELQSICGVVSNGRMPPPTYKLLHPESRVAAQDKKMICAWVANELKYEK